MVFSRSRASIDLGYETSSQLLGAGTDFESLRGPVILAYGRNEGNRDRFYLAIGKRF